MLAVRELVRSLVSIVAPRLCAGCRAPLEATPEVEGEGSSPRTRTGAGRDDEDAVRAALRPFLCAGCRERVHPIGEAACVACGRPRPPFAGPRGARCGRCLFEARGGVRATVAAYRYSGLGRDLLRALKFSDRRAVAEPLGRALAARVERELPDVVGACGVALVTAVPIHWSRRLARGFNQAELIGRACARELGLPFLPRALRRARRTRALFSIHRADRAEELEGAIRADAAVVRDRWILVVDDIRTSGATLAACGRALRLAGAVRVDAAVVGR